MKEKLIELLRKKISEENSNNYYSHLDSNIDEKLETIIKNLPDNITLIDISELEELLWNIHTTINVEDILTKVRISQTLLKRSDLGFQLDEDQIEALGLLRKELINKRIEISNARTNTNEETLDECHKILLSLNSDDHDFITNPSLISDLMKENNYSFEEQKKMWMFLLKFNSEVYEKSDVVKIESEEEMEETNLDIESVKELFSKYGYDFMTFDEQARELILEFGIIKEMDDVFSFLANNNLLNNKLELSRLTNLLLYSNAELIEKVLTQASEKGMDKEEVFKYAAVLISKKRDGEKVTRRHKEHSRREVDKKYGSNCSGCYENFMNNINLLEEKGIDLVSVSENCFGLLEAYPLSIEANFKLLELYGIDIIPRGDKKSNYTSYVSFASIPLFDNIDNLIELGYDEILSGLGLGSFNRNLDVELRRLKHAKSNGREIFRTYKANRDRISISRKEMYDINNDDYTRDPEHIIVDLNIPNKDAFDEIVLRNRNTNVSSQLENDANIKYLEENYKQDDRHYQIDGIVISRMKVLRIYQTLLDNGIKNDDSFLYAVTYRSLLTSSEYDKLQDNLFGLKIERGAR